MTFRRWISSIAVVIALFGISRAQSEYNQDVQVQNILKTGTTSIGQRIEYRNFEENEVTVLKVTIPPGKETGWHKHTIPVYAYVLKGKITIEVDNGRTVEFGEDSSFAEVIDTMHNGKNNGTTDVTLIAFFMGGKGKPITIPK